MSGLEALQALRLMARGAERLPVIMLSADVTPEAKREALEAGADAFLPKPIETMRLLDEIQALAGRHGEGTRRREARAEVCAVAPAQAALPVVNAQTLEYLQELGSSASFIEKLVRVFVDDSAKLLARIEQVLTARDYREFRSLVHAMKGSSASIGTDRLTRLCSSFGALSDVELRREAQALHRTLADELGAARSELERFVQEKRRSAL
jgi:two-component system sensor histidine kinase RpfC